MKKRPPAKKPAPKAAPKPAPKVAAKPMVAPKAAATVPVPTPLPAPVPEMRATPSAAETPVVGLTHMSSRAPMLWQKPESAAPSPLAVLERRTRFWIAVLLAPIGGCGIAGGLYGLVNGLVFLLPNGLAVGLLGGVLTGMAGMVAGSLVGAALGWPLMLTFGLAYNTFLSRRGLKGEATLTLGFALLGALVGVAVGLGPEPAARFGTVPQMPALALTLPWCMLAGAVSGWLFWFIRK